MEGPTTKRDFREKRKSGEVFPFGGSGPQKIFVFLSSLDLISCNFSMIFAHFQTKRDITRGAKTLQWGAGGGGGGNIAAGGGALAPLVYMLKKALPRIASQNNLKLHTVLCVLRRHGISMIVGQGACST